MHYWISQQATLECKRNALLEKRKFYVEKIREIDEKHEATQINLTKADSMIKEYFPMLQEATISSTTIGRHKKAFSKVLIDSNAIITRFRDCIVNNL